MTAIPDHLAGRPRMANGLPIPYVADDTSPVGPELTDLGGFVFPALCNAKPAGEPLPGQHSPERQRRVMAKWLCQVCARPIDGPGVFIGGPVGMVPSAVQWREPQACIPCAAYSLRVCPGIARPAREGRIHVLLAHRPDVELRWAIEPGWSSGVPTRAEGEGNRKVVPTSWLRDHADQLLGWTATIAVATIHQWQPVTLEQLDDLTAGRAPRVVPA